ncbi:MAG: cation diffusion facilitator family transporter [Cyanobacteria bacterium P01_F01_bin.150]
MVAIFAGFEFMVGHISHSLALQADSGHMMSDGLALAIALFATYMARSSVFSKEYRAFSQQVETWAALINGLGLLGMAGLIGWEAYSHWQSPPSDILSIPMLITAIIGLVINGISFQWIQSFNDGESKNAVVQNSRPLDLNLQGVLLHVLADVLGSVGVILAAIAVWIWGWIWADNVISVALALLIGGSAISLIRQSIIALRSSWYRPGQASVFKSSKDLTGQAAVLSKVGFCEIGQTNLSQIVKDLQASD